MLFRIYLIDDTRELPNGHIPPTEKDGKTGESYVEIQNLLELKGLGAKYLETNTLRVTLKSYMKRDVNINTAPLVHCGRYEIEDQGAAEVRQFHSSTAIELWATTMTDAVTLWREILCGDITHLTMSYQDQTFNNKKAAKAVAEANLADEAKEDLPAPAAN